MKTASPEMFFLAPNDFPEWMGPFCAQAVSFDSSRSGGTTYLDRESGTVPGDSGLAGNVGGGVAVHSGHEAGIGAGLGELAKGAGGPQHRGLQKLGEHGGCGSV